MVEVFESRDEEIVGLVYVTTGTEPDDDTVERAELGGIFVAESCRDLGLATALGIASIANYFVNDTPRGRMIAHVHEFNELPRGLLQARLGFRKVGTETPPDHIAPKSMKRNAKGEVVGDLFQLDRAVLARFADWLETFRSVVSGRAGESDLELQLPSMTRYRLETVEALRDLAKRR